MIEKISERIKEISALLKATSEMPDKNILEEYQIKSLKTRKGKVFVLIYDNLPECSCAKFYCSEGSEMDWHVHKVIQIMVCIKGEALFYLNGDQDKEVILKEGDVIRFLPGEKHFAVMTKYTEFYDIKIPSE